MLLNTTVNTGGLVKKTDYSSKIMKIKNKIPNTSSLINKTNITGLGTKTNFNTKVMKIQNKINFADIVSIKNLEKYLQL